jgi:hypothetical protein
MYDDTCGWAREEYAQASLGDRRRTRRVVALAAAVARRPAGPVTAVLDDSADREGAYRLLGNAEVRAADLMAARHDATVRRCRGERHVFVAVDSSSLSFSDLNQVRDIGKVGGPGKGGRGLIMTSALALTLEGTPIGLCGQSWWARTRPSLRKSKPKDAAGNELKHAVDVIQETLGRLWAQAPGTRPWFQLDRGFDSQMVLRNLIHEGCLFTVRGSQRRLLVSPEDSPRTKVWLWPTVRGSKPIGHKTIEVPARGDRPARVARLEIRIVRVTLRLKISNKRWQPAELTAVHASEKTPGGLEWLLLTSAPASTLAEAAIVIDGYTTRWRVEDFHRAWKRGLCNVEDSQLRGREALLKWATLHGSVAARATRLTHLAREKPELPADEEFSRDEIDAVIVLKKKIGLKRGAVPELGEMVRWIADLGGYTGRSSGGPPGATVVGRGLERVAEAAELLKALREREL